MSTRAGILHAVEEIICKDRNVQHGEPENVFSDIADLWGVYLDKPIAPEDVAALMVLFKIARFKANPKHPDNYLDAVGYAAIMGELASRGAEKTPAQQARDAEQAVLNAWRGTK